jgi:hypothetical protein
MVLEIITTNVIKYLIRIQSQSCIKAHLHWRSLLAILCHRLSCFGHLGMGSFLFYVGPPKKAKASTLSVAVAGIIAINFANGKMALEMNHTVDDALNIWPPIYFA